MMDYAIKLVDDTKRGPIAVLKNDSHMSKWCEEAKSIVHDQTVPLHILPLFKEGDTVVDVGANIGTHTVAYAERVGTTGKVFAFEPYLPSFVCLAMNCRDLPQVKPQNYVLGSKSGICQLELPQDTNMGTVCVSAYLGSCEARIETLDNYVLKSCAFIKIDAEGWETEVILGATKTIERCKPIMVVELNDGALRRYGLVKQNVLDLMSSLGYSHEFIDHSHTLDMPQVDIIARPK